MVTNEERYLRDSVISCDLKHRATLRHNIYKYDESVARGKNRYVRYNEAREYASDIKEAALAKLADHPELFENNASERGTKVLWAGDATDAMHKSKEDVAALFQGKFGTDKNASPAELTAFVRKKIRTQFVAAGVGVTGANFLVADIGGVSLTENEGNALMTVSFPKVHIVLAGIERLIPSVSQLPFFWQWLGVHGTGQNISACNTLMLGPMESVLTPFYSGFKEFGHLSSASVICGHCTEVCPVKIPLHELLLLNRRRKVEEAGESIGWNLGMKAYGYAFSSRKRLDFFIGRIKRRLIKLAGSPLGEQKEMPPVALPSFSKSRKSHH